jgi:hypothetical protein
MIMVLCALPFRPCMLQLLQLWPGPAGLQASICQRLLPVLCALRMLHALLWGVSWPQVVPTQLTSGKAGELQPCAASEHAAHTLLLPCSCSSVWRLNVCSMWCTPIYLSACMLQSHVPGCCCLNQLGVIMTLQSSPAAAAVLIHTVTEWNLPCQPLWRQSCRRCSYCVAVSLCCIEHAATVLLASNRSCDGCCTSGVQPARQPSQQLL